MSPGQTFERVYLELKRQLREGTRSPGTPLEPTAIGDELGTSFTPVRDALHRLVGEGLVENPRHNGFAVPQLTERALRDLYAWNGELIALLGAPTWTAAAPFEGDQPTATGRGHDSAESLFCTIAEATGNREHAKTVAQLNDRLAPFRLVEQQIFRDGKGDVAMLAAVFGTRLRREFTRSIDRYHRKRIAAVPQILALMEKIQS